MSENNPLLEIDQIFDEILPNQINLQSFETKDTLCPKIWVNGDMKKIIRAHLKNIATDFIEDFKLNIPIEDIVIVGSIAGYNWSKYSDIDLHIIVDFEKVNQNVDFVKQFFDAKRALWNAKHNDLLIYGYPVELYVQDINEKNESNGIYSVVKKCWVKIPNGGNVLQNKEIIKAKASRLINIIDKYEEYTRTHKMSTAKLIRLKELADEIHDEIVQGRRTSLPREGEYAADNIVFKVLRRSGHIGKLNDLRVYLGDKIKSIR